MSYSTDFRDGFYRSAYFVDRLLKGTKPSGKACYARSKRPPIAARRIDTRSGRHRKDDFTYASLDFLRTDQAPTIPKPSASSAYVEGSGTGSPTSRKEALNVVLPTTSVPTRNQSGAIPGSLRIQL